MNFIDPSGWIGGVAIGIGKNINAKSENPSSKIKNMKDSLVGATVQAVTGSDQAAAVAELLSDLTPGNGNLFSQILQLVKAYQDAQKVCEGSDEEN